MHDQGAFGSEEKWKRRRNMLGAFARCRVKRLKEMIRVADSCCLLHV